MTRLLIQINKLIFPFVLFLLSPLGSLAYGKDNQIGTISRSSTEIRLVIAPRVTTGDRGEIIKTNLETMVFHSETLMFHAGVKLVILIPE